MSYNVDGSAIQEIKELVVDASPILEENVHGGETFLIREPDGSVRVLEVPVLPASHTAFDLESLKAMADRDHQPGSSVFVTGIFVSDSQIQTITEDDLHRTTNTLALPLHPAFQHLLSWKRLTPIGQKELVRLLRTELRDHVDPTVISKFASLKFTDNRETSSQVRPTSAALDQSIRQRVATDNGQDAPETITVHTPVYDIPEARGDQYDVTVYVEYDYDAGKFLLLTVHGDLRRAQEAAVAELVDDLKVHAADRFPVLYGKPS